MSIGAGVAAGLGEGRSGWRVWLPPLVLVLALGGYAAAGFALGVDGNYDLRNYHYYNGWALFHKPVGFDLAPAQVQSYQHPLLDGLFYLASSLLNDRPRWLTAVWSIPQAVAVWVAFEIAGLVLAEGGVAAGWGRDGLALAAAAIGAGGAVTVGVIGTSMSEALPNLAILGGVWCCLDGWRREQGGVGGAGRFAWAGVLAGVAAGLKLTTAPYVIAFGVATLLTPGVGVRRRGVVLAALVGGTVASLVLVGAPWWVAVYRVFGNPVFPYFNAVFHSRFYGDWNFVDDRYFPRTAWQWVAYPLQWTLRKSTLPSEQPVRDARLLLELVGAVVLLGRWLAGRRGGGGAVWCGVFVGSAYGVWLVAFSILRYASALETLSGVMIVAGLAALLGGRVQAARQAAVAWGVAGVLCLTTVYPTWERRTHGVRQFAAVSLPHLPADALVLMLVDTPASYVAAFEPASVRFVGLYNSLLRLESTFGFQDLVVETIRTAPGAIWGLDKTDAFFGKGEESLARYGLHRTGTCSRIESNLDTHLRICELERG